MTGRLNQDCLKNFFSVIRAKGGLHDHPSPLEFKYRFRAYLLGRNESILCSEANVQSTNDELLGVTVLSQDIFKEVFDSIEISDKEQLKIAEEHEHNNVVNELHCLNDVEFDGLENFGGYLVSKLKLSEYGRNISSGEQE